MKNTILIMALISHLMFFALSCSKDNPAGQTDDEGLIGSWNWIESVSSTGPDARFTPQTEGYTMKFVFKPDSTFERYRNDSLRTQCNFSVIYDEIYPGASDSASMVVFKDYFTFPQQIFQDHPDTLGLSATGEGFTRLTLVRIRE